MVIDKCDICGGKIEEVFALDFKSLFGLEDEYTQHIGMCPVCQSVFTMNPFDGEKLANRYKNFSKYEFDSDADFMGEDYDYKIRTARQKRFIERIIGLDNIESMLEVGAASGYNLSLYSDICNVYGIEPSQVNCKSAKKYYGVDMFCGMFDEYVKTNPQEKFDLIFLSHVLEHIANPCTFIRQCSEINSKYMFIEVPTLDYKFVDEPFAMMFEEHINMFTVENLEVLMRECGYKLIDVDMVMSIQQKISTGFPAISTAWVKCNKDEIKLHKPSFSSYELFSRYIEMSQKEMQRIQSIIDTIENDKKLAVWGTGHHASILMANTDLCDKNIVRIYDSDLKKQGELFAGVKIQPFTEDDIKEKNVDVILLATYSSQEALVRVTEKYASDVRIVTLYDL